MIFREGNIVYWERKQEQRKLTWVSVKYYKINTAVLRWGNHKEEPLLKKNISFKADPLLLMKLI